MKFTTDSSHSGDKAYTYVGKVTMNKVTPVVATSPTVTSDWNYDGISRVLSSGGSMKHSSSDSTTVAGSFNYGDAVTNPGIYDASWTFTPSDTTNYNSTAGSSGYVCVNKYNPTLLISTII